MKNWAQYFVKVATKSLLLGLRWYQLTISPDHGVFGWGNFYRCRFYPSCSEYAVASIRQYGLFHGSVLSLKRIFRCNPWNKGGDDAVGGAH